MAPRFCAKGNPYSPPPTQDRDARPPAPPGGALERARMHPGARVGFIRAGIQAARPATGRGTGPDPGPVAGAAPGVALEGTI